MWFIQGLFAFLGRAMIVTIFLLSAVGKIMNYTAVTKDMAEQTIPQSSILLGGAIAFLILGGLSVLLGYKARLGALLLLIFLAAATYYFHDFWQAPAEKQQAEMIQFMKNLALMGTMVFLIANGPGPGSLDNRVKPIPVED